MTGATETLIVVQVLVGLALGLTLLVALFRELYR